MGGRIRQRTIYAATAVAVLTLVTGFAIASITNFNLTTSAQGSGSVTTTGTNYQCASPTCLQSTIMSGSTTAAACINAPTATTFSSTSLTTVNIVVNVASTGANCAGGDFAEEFSFVSSFTVGTNAPTCFTTAAATCSDNFLVSSVIGTSATNAEVGTVAFTQSTTSPVTSGTTISVNVSLYVDYGVTANPTPGVSSVSVVVNGNY